MLKSERRIAHDPRRPIPRPRDARAPSGVASSTFRGPEDGRGRYVCIRRALQLRANRLFAVLAQNVRDYAIFLTDGTGVIRFWGEGALMKW